MAGRVRVFRSVETLIRGHNSRNFLRVLLPLSFHCRCKVSEIPDTVKKGEFDCDANTVQSQDNGKLSINDRLKSFAENDDDTQRAHDISDTGGILRITRPVKMKHRGSDNRRNAFQNQFKFSGDAKRDSIARSKYGEKKEQEFKQMKIYGESIWRQYDTRESQVFPATRHKNAGNDAHTAGADLLHVEQELRQINKDRKSDHVLPGLGKRKRRPGLSCEEDKGDANVPVIKGEMLFGLHPVLLALKFGRRDLHCLYITEKGDNSHSADVQKVISLAEEKGIPIKHLTLGQMDRSANYRPHQGVCLDVSRLKALVYSSQETGHTKTTDVPLESSQSGRLPLWLVLYQVQDPMNFGAILRSAYLFGVKKILKTSQNSCSLTPVVSKASAGVLEVIDIVSINHQITDFIQAQQALGWAVIGTTGQGTQAGLHMDERTEGITTETGEATCNPMAGMLPAPGDATGSPASDQCRLAEQENSLTTGEFTSYRPIPVQDYCFDKPTILIVGNEGSGLPTEVLSACDEVVYAELAGSKGDNYVLNSLNVSVATGILLHCLTVLKMKKRT